MTNTIDVLDPRTGEPWGSIPAGDPSAVAAAVARAELGLGFWSALSQEERSRHLRAVAHELLSVAEELAQIESRDAGKALDDARLEIDASIAQFDHFADAAEADYIEQQLAEGGRIRRRPFGVTALIVPWNFPLLIAFRFLPGMIAPGNTVVWKPSERTPMSAIKAFDVMSRVLPAGVVELVLGDGRAGQPLVDDERVKLVALTGSTATGIRVGETSGRLLRPALLELGGKDAVIVDRDVDVAAAARQVAEGSFFNVGQICTSMERIFVHRDVADDFIRELAERARSDWNLEIDGGKLGPMIDDRQREIVLSHIADAVNKGATVITGGSVPDHPGYYFPATVIVGCTSEMSIMSDETFGPIAAVEVVDSFHEGVHRASSLDYGLAATVMTNSLENQAFAVSQLDVGTVWINTWHSYADGAVHEAGGKSGLGAIGWRGRQFLDAVTAPQFVSTAS